MSLICCAGLTRCQAQPAAPAHGPPPNATSSFASLWDLFSAITPHYLHSWDAGLAAGKTVGDSPTVQYMQRAMHSTSPPRSTVLFIGDDVWARMAAAYCMTVEEMLSLAAANPEATMSFMFQHTVFGGPLWSADFRDGLEFKTARPTPNIRKILHKKTSASGEVMWYFKNSSIMFTDIHIVRTDIVAGKDKHTVVHLLDNMFRDSSTVAFWEQQRDLLTAAGKGACAKPKEPAPPAALSPGAITGVVVGAVAGAGLLAAGVAVLVARRRAAQRGAGSTHKRLWPPAPGAPGFGSNRVLPTKDLAALQPSEAAGFAGGGSLLLAGSQGGVMASHPSAASSRVALTDSLSTASALDDGGSAFVAAPTVPEGQLAAWLQSRRGRGLPQRSAESSSSSSSGSDSSGGSVARFGEDVRQELALNPNLAQNYTNCVRAAEHAQSAVCFAEGAHNRKPFALKLLGPQRHAEFVAEMRVYQRLAEAGCAQHVPALELAYAPSPPRHIGVLVLARGQCTLEEFLRSQAHRPTYFQQVDLFMQLLAGLEAIHSLGLVHRDLKPSNVVLYPERVEWKLIDLATVAPAGDMLPAAYTLEYAAPEVAQAVVGGGGRVLVQPAADIWSLGALMFEVATGKRFMPAEWLAQGGQPRAWSALCGYEPLPCESEDLSKVASAAPGLLKTVRRMLQRDPGSRPTARQLRQSRLFQVHGSTTTHIGATDWLSGGDKA